MDVAQLSLFHLPSVLAACSLLSSFQMPHRPSILLIDDSPGECELFRLALAQTGLDAVLFDEPETAAALHFLKVETKVEVKLIVLDWRLRNHTGTVFLERLRADTRLAAIPVVVFTTSDDVSDMMKAYASGANGYVVKPGTFDELVHCVRDICRYWLSWNLWPVTAASQR
jgi:DNA-binding response OmpR family regulator